MRDITRKHAQQRSAVIKARSYQILIDVSGNDHDGAPLPSSATHFISTSTVTFFSSGGLSHIDIIADKILYARIDDEELALNAFDGHIYAFETTTGKHELTITALCRYSNSSEGLHRFVDPTDDRVYLYSQFEVADARRAFACFDQPDQKATFQFSIITPPNWIARSNSVPVEPVVLDNGLYSWRFPQSPPIATYLAAIVAGEYHVVNTTLASRKGDIKASMACRQSMAQHLDTERILDITQRGLNLFETIFNHSFPFDSYDQIFVPEFNFNAMENAGCVVMRDDYLFRSRVTSAEYEARENIILHELAHMWFGGLVTMRWWDDLWLNESFAEWAAYYAQYQFAKADRQKPNPWVLFTNNRKSWAYHQDQLPTTHPVAADMANLVTVEQNFDAITYAKGAAVLKLLVNVVGKRDFLTGLANYFNEFAFKNTDLTNVLAHLEKASGRDLSWVSEQWLETTGFNTFYADFEVDEQNRFTRFEIVQTAALDATLRRHSLNIGIYQLDYEELRLIDLVDVYTGEERTEVPELIGRTRGDLVLLNDSDITYARTRLDQQSFSTAFNYLTKILNPLQRALLLAIAWDMTRNGEISTIAYLDLAISSVATETDQSTVRIILDQALIAATRYTDSELRYQLRDDLVSGVARQLKQVAPGSDTQLSLVRALASAIYTDAGAELLRGWLAGEEIPLGLVVDADLRWHLLRELARLGAIGAADIAAEAARDHTSAGVEQAAGVLSALADNRAKTESWRLATADPTVSNEILRQICQNFFQFDQEELLTPYLDDYLEVLTEIANRQGVWKHRGSAARDTVLRYLFPTALADRGFLNRVKQWLVEHNDDLQITRAITERIYESERALYCQEENRKDSANLAVALAN
ncbi:MAG: aminopeptidase N [Propionibacterium sp.]|nr:MAG: aminopeptidase N [Propionibacterium sp.]